MSLDQQSTDILKAQLDNIIGAIKLPPSIGINWDQFEKDIIDFLDSAPPENNSLENLKEQLEAEIADLEKNAIKEIENQIVEKVDEIKNLRETLQRQVEDRIANVLKQIDEIEEQIENLKDQKKQIEKQIKEKEEELRDTESIKQNLENKAKTELTNAEEELDNEVNNLEEQKQQLQNRLLNTSDESIRDILRRQIEDINQTILDVRESAKQKIEALKETLRSIPAQIKEQVENIKNQIESIKQKLKQLIDTITNTEKIKENLNKLYEQLKETLKKIKEDIKKKIDQLKNLEDVVLKQLKEKVRLLKEELQKIKQQLISLLNFDLRFSRSFLIAAERISTAYFKAVSSGQTLFGNKVMVFNKMKLQKSLEIAFTLQYLNGIVPMGQVPYYIIAAGLLSSWSTSTISPLPPNPPAVTPAPFTPSNIIVFPGSIFPLGTFLKYAFADFNSIKTPAITAKFLRIAFQFHTSTIVGSYVGMMPSPTGLIPTPPIPWIGIF